MGGGGTSTFSRRHFSATPCPLLQSSIYIGIVCNWFPNTLPQCTVKNNKLLVLLGWQLVRNIAKYYNGNINSITDGLIT